ncbi:MAG: lysophospholipid acyltransferase family protein [Acidimicrobiia bacterium]
MLYWAIKGVLTPTFHAAYKLEVTGKENVPTTGPVILAANHRSFLDSIFVPLLIPRKVTYVAKAEYFDSRKTAWFFRSIGQIPIRRDGGSASDGALLAAQEVLEHGGVMGIYPEGTRSRDGYLHRGHTGVARLALATGAPIIPVGLIGTDEAQPSDKKFPRINKRITVRFGEPLDVEKFGARNDDRMRLRSITDELMFELADLTGYQYVDTYAARGGIAPAHPPIQRLPEALAS